MININDLKVGSKLKQIKPIVMDGEKVGCVGKDYTIRSIQGKGRDRMVVFEEKIENDYFAVYKECLDYFMVVK